MIKIDLAFRRGLYRIIPIVFLFVWGDRFIIRKGYKALRIAMPTKAKRITSIALIFILIIPLFTVLIPMMPEALGLIYNPDEAIEFKEHKFWAGGNPFWRYTNSTGGAPANTFWQSTAQNANDQGYSYVFFVFRGSLLNGATLNIRHSLTINFVINYGIYVYDGSYNRTSDIDFPPGAALLVKGNGLIQTVNETAASFAVKTETYTLSFTNSLTWVTLFFRISDGGGAANTAVATYYNMSIVRGATTLFSTDFDGNILCDLAEEDMLRCSDNAWPDTFLNSSGYLDAGIVDINPCVPTDFEIMNPSAKAEDGTPWVFTETKFYWFNATYINFNLTGGDEASIRFSPDGLTNVTVSYAWLNDINGLLSASDGPDFITVPSVARNGTGAVYNSTTLVLWVNFPVWFTDNSPDAQYVDVYYACTGLDYIDSGEDFHIYNQGGLVERSPTDANTTFTAGGDWFEMCANTTLDDVPAIISANQTWRKLQHFQTEFAVHFYYVDGTPEDQFMQDANHLGALPETVWSAPAEWIITFRIYGYDNVTESWVMLIYTTMNMEEGDEGANDEWIRIRSIIGDQTAGVVSDYWNAFIEEEPAARFRTWLDIWVNKINASSVIGARINAYYFGMDDSGYLFWATWNPMLDNSTEVIGFTDIEDGNLNTTQARNYDLMKIETELSMTYASASNNYTVCIEEININEVTLASIGEELSGVNTPIFIAPKVPDMPIGGILAPLYAAITSLGETLWGALTGLTGIVWEAIGARFPWFTSFFENIAAILGDLASFFGTIVGYLGNLFAWGVGFLGYLATPITMIQDIYGALVDNTAIFFAVNPSEVSLLLILIVVFIPFMEAFSRGDSSYVLRSLSIMWGVARTILDFSITLIGKVVSWLLEALPL